MTIFLQTLLNLAFNMFTLFQATTAAGSPTTEDPEQTSISSDSFRRGNSEEENVSGDF